MKTTRELRAGTRYYRLRTWTEAPGPGGNVSASAPWILRSVSAASAALVLGDALATVRRALEHAESPFEAVLHEIETGRLVLEEALEPALPALRPVERTEREDPVEQTLDWIEVEIVDPLGHPIPFVLVEVVLPNKQASRVMANENGFVRLDEIPSGQCTIRLPHWDRRSWRTG